MDIKMKYIKDYKEGDRVYDIYFCKFKSSAITKNGKSYDNVILQDKTGTLDAKIWDPNNAGISDFNVMARRWRRSRWSARSRRRS